MGLKMTKFGIDFGELRQRIVINNLVVSRDDIGGEVQVKQLFAQCWAKVEMRDGLVNYQNKVSHDSQTCVFYIRYLSGVKAQMIVDFDDGSYEIQSVLNLEQCDKWLKILTFKK